MSPSIAEHLARRLKEAGYGTRPVNGAAQGDWVLVDAGDVIVHVFRPEVRDYYDLEGMWSCASARTAAAVSRTCVLLDSRHRPCARHAGRRAVRRISATAPARWAAIWAFPPSTVEELPVSKARDAATRMADEAERLAAAVPDGAHIVLLDARGKGMTREDFAEMLGACAMSAPRIWSL